MRESNIYICVSIVNGNVKLQAEDYNVSHRCILTSRSTPEFVVGDYYKVEHDVGGGLHIEFYKHGRQSKTTAKEAPVAKPAPKTKKTETKASTKKVIKAKSKCPSK